MQVARKVGYEDGSLAGCMSRFIDLTVLHVIHMGRAMSPLIVSVRECLSKKRTSGEGEASIPEIKVCVAHASFTCISLD